MSFEQTAMARLLQRSRERASYSRAGLAKLLELPEKTIEGWENGKAPRPRLHDVVRMATFLQIPYEAIQQAVFSDAGSVPDLDTQPQPAARRKPGRKPAVPLLEAGFVVCGWETEQEAAEALGVSASKLRAWRRGREPLDLDSHLRLSSTVNLALANAAKDEDDEEQLRLALNALGVSLRT